MFRSYFYSIINLFLGIYLLSAGFYVYAVDRSFDEDNQIILNSVVVEITKYGSERNKKFLTKNSLNGGSYFSQPDCVIFSYFSEDFKEIFLGFLVQKKILYQYKNPEFNDSCKLTDKWIAISDPLTKVVLGANFIGTPVVSVELIIEDKLVVNSANLTKGADVYHALDLVNIGIEY